MHLQENEWGILSLYRPFCVRIVCENKYPTGTGFCVIFLRLFDKMIHFVRISCDPIPDLNLGQLKILPNLKMPSNPMQISRSIARRLFI